MLFRAIIILLLGCSFYAAAQSTPITEQPWQEAVVSVSDLDRSAEFFTSIGGYEQKWRGQVSAEELDFWGLKPNVSAEALLLGPKGQSSGLVRLIRFDNAGLKVPTRPGSRAWDTGCYFSLMVRMKDMESIYHDAIKLGWWTETPISYLEFGTSKLNIMIFTGPDGVQIQGYERLSPALPDTIPDFERMNRPFNIMQMVRSREVSYDFFTKQLGFSTFYNGPAYYSKKPEYMPLGIPKNLTTSVGYKAGIVSPVPGEFGRMEMIEIMELDGRDYSQQCNAPNLGILAVRFAVNDIDEVKQQLTQRAVNHSAILNNVPVAPYGKLNMLSIKTPDGANIHFYEKGR